MLGVFAVLAGLGTLAGIDLPLFGLFLVFVGVLLVLRPYFQKRS